MNQTSTGSPQGRPAPALDDPLHDPYVALEALASPSVCSECGAVFAAGRWQWMPAPPGAAAVSCPACLRQRDRQPAGELAIDPGLAGPHREAIVALARNLEASGKRDHPLQRIMAIEPVGPDGALRITTTDPHLARSLGEALEQRFQASATYAFAKADYLLRVEVRP